MSDCFHCGLPVPAGATWSVVIDETPRAMCCPGCEAAAQAIVDYGLTSYYRDRVALPGRVDADSLVPPELRLVDRAENLKSILTSESADRCSATLSVEGLRCAACSWLIEGRLARVPGVAIAEMNVGAGRLHVEWDPKAVKLSDLLLAIRGIGYLAYPNDARRQGAALIQAAKGLQRRLFVALLSMMQVMMYAAPAYFADDGTLDAESATIMRWASLILTIPCVLYSADLFFKGAWRALRNGHADMDLSVALGILGAFIGSTVATVTGQGDVYFDSVSMFVFLLLCSRTLELMARQRAVAGLERLQQGLPEHATKMAGYPADRSTSTVAPSELQPGDVVLVKPGEAFPCDGTVIEGSTAADLSLLSGESKPLAIAAGATVPGGAINTRQAVLLRVERETADSTLSRLLELAGQAGMGKPRLALWADRVGAWFVPVLLALAGAAFLYWYRIAGLGQAWEIAVAVLVVSCPCALSLATPTALAAATDQLLRHGVLMTQGPALETLQRATHIVFDKTGTLTEGRPGLRSTTLLGDIDEAQALRLAAALEAGNAHPLARALLAAAPEGMVPADELHYTQGQGIEGVVDGRRYRLGTAGFVGALAGTSLPAGDPANDATPVYLAAEGAWLACFALADALRPETAEVIAACQADGKEVVILSGDHPDAVRHLAERLNIKNARGGCLPEQKLAFVRELQAGGAIVAMVGDGINDAAVLSAADVSFAMGSGAALAQVHADAILMGGIAAFGLARRMADRSLRIIRQNLWWASLYNLLAIPAAAAGLIGPLLSGIGMATSSMVVVANAWRLRRRGA